MTDIYLLKTFMLLFCSADADVSKLFAFTHKQQYYNLQADHSYLIFIKQNQGIEKIIECQLSVKLLRYSILDQCEISTYIKFIIVIISCTC